MSSRSERLTWLFIISNYSVTNEFEIRLKILYKKSIVLIRSFQVIRAPPFVGSSEEPDNACVPAGPPCRCSFHFRHILIS